MGLVSLIVPTPKHLEVSTEQVGGWRNALAAAGHSSEVLIVQTSSSGESEVHLSEWSTILSETNSLAAAAIRGLRSARGDLLLVLDPTMGYDPADLVAVANALVSGEVELAVANRWLGDGSSDAKPASPVARSLGLVRAGVAALVGTSDPFSGLVGTTRAAFQKADETFSAAGTKFSFELLAKIGGRVVEVPARLSHRSRRSAMPRWHMLSMDEVRHLKRLADHRFGNLSRLIQFCVVGVTGMVVDLSCYAAFQLFFAVNGWFDQQAVPVVGGPLALAISGFLSIAIALCWNFSLNRRLTFSYSRTGSLARQFITYALSNAIGIVLSLSLRLSLPRYSSFFNHHRLAAALVGIVLATGISFSLSRWVVFSSKPGDNDKQADDPANEAQTRSHNALDSKVALAEPSPVS